MDGAKLRYLVIDRKPITRFGGYDYEVRCKSLQVQHGYWLRGAAAPGWEKNRDCAISFLEIYVQLYDFEGFCRQMK